MVSKTVVELIEFLKTQPQDMTVEAAYDGSDWELYVFQDNGVLRFSSQTYGNDHNFDVEILFTAARRDA